MKEEIERQRLEMQTEFEQRMAMMAPTAVSATAQHVRSGMQQWRQPADLSPSQQCRTAEGFRLRKPWEMEEGDTLTPTSVRLKKAEAELAKSS